MSTVQVQGSKTDTADNTPPRRRFEFRDAERSSRAPLLIALVLAGAVAFLKSLFNSEDAEARPEQKPGSANLEGVAEEADTEPRLGVPKPRSNPEGYETDDTVRQPSDIDGRIADFPLRPSISGDAIFFRPALSSVGSGTSSDHNPVFAGNDNLPSPGEPIVDDASGPDSSSAKPATNPPDDPEDSDDDETGETDERNKAPQTNAYVRLNDVLAGQVVLIGLSEFLSTARDPDGDELTVDNVRVTTGSIAKTAEGWVYSSNWQTPETEVGVTFDISDGQTTITRTTSFQVAGHLPIVGGNTEDVLRGSERSDEIDALSGDDLVDAGEGDDVILGGDGNDHIVAGAGNDIIKAGNGDDVVYAGRGDDVISGGNGSDRLFGDDGADVIAGDDGNDLIQGGHGDDHLVGGAGSDVVAGDEGNDVLLGGAGSDLLKGGQGDDRIEDGGGRDAVAAGAGNDVVIVSADQSADTFDGGSGEDTLDLSASTTPLLVSLLAGTVRSADLGEADITGFEAVLTGSENDKLLDGLGEETLHAGAGDDLIVVAADGLSDVFDGSMGDDIMDLSTVGTGAEVDLINGRVVSAETGVDEVTGFERIVGGSGDDTFRVGGNGTTEVTLIGGAGNDIFHFAVTAGNSQGTAELFHKILDFMVGDRLFVADYEFQRTRGETGQERFERIYGDGDGLDEDEFVIRLSNQVDGQIEFAVIEVDRDRDDTFEFSVEIYGSTPLNYSGLSAV